MTIPNYQENEPGHAAGRETSLEGAQVAMNFAATDRELILGIIKLHAGGCTRDELVAAVAKHGRNLQPSSISARLLELFKTCQVCHQTDEAGQHIARPGKSKVRQLVYYATHQPATHPRKLPTRFNAGWDAALAEIEKRVLTEHNGWLVSPGVQAMLELVKGMKKNV